MNPNYAAKVEEEIDKLLRVGFIRPVKRAIWLSSGWSEAEPVGCAELVDSVREVSVTRESDLVLWARPS